MKRKIIVPIVVSILILGLIVFLPVIKNNIILNRFAKQLYDIPVTGDTYIISGEKKLGHFGASRSSLNFWAVIEIYSPLSAEDLADRYSNKTLKSANEVTFFKLKPLDTIFGENPSETQNDVQISVMQKKKSMRGNTGIYSEISVADDSIGEDLFIIQIFDGVYVPGWDLRAQ